MSEHKEVTFYFDPSCPWAWRASLWIREVARVRPLSLNWQFLSLAAVNAGKDNLKEAHSQSLPIFRGMALARRQGGEEAVDKLYLAVGKAKHDRKEDLGSPETLAACFKEAGLTPDLIFRAEDDPSTLEGVQKSHSRIVGLKGFGVPTMIIKEKQRESPAMFGPVINSVPQGEEAGKLWDRIEWLMWQPDFFELKRSR